MIRSASTGAVLILFAFAWSAQADIYRWKDAGGVTHFTQTPPPAGATLVEIIEETPYDAAADRKRGQEERRLRLEREKLDLESRAAELAAREREAQFKLNEAARKLEEAERQMRDSEAEAEAERDDGFLRYGVYGHGRRYTRGMRPGDANLYRGYHREGGNLYYEDPRRPKPHPIPPDRPPRPKEGPSRKKPQAQKPQPGAVEEPSKGTPPARGAPARQ